MAQILGSTPNHGPTRPPSCGSLPTGRFAADGHPADRWHLPGDLPVMTRGAATEVVTSADLSGAAFARSRFRARAVDRPSQRGYGRGRGCRVCWGQAPERCRSARPRAKARGRGVFSQNQAPRATGATDTHCPPYGGACQLGNARTRTNLRRQRPWHHREGPAGIAESDSTAAARAYGRG
jgi:hypothetical protein